jgi:excinuclease UvrABC nuclease subunit
MEVTQDVRVTVSFEWIEVGPIELDRGGKLNFPILPREPGIYKLMITERDGTTASYVGETDELRRRFSHYRNPGPTQPTNRRINTLVTQLLADGGRASMAIATGAALEINDVSSSLDLTKKAARLLAENAALVKATLDGVNRIENL